MYSKVFKSVYYGSLRKEPEAREVFICLLTHISDRAGNVDMTPEVLASLLHKQPDQIEAALQILEAPDPNSTTPDEEGRRIIPTSTGWHVVNYSKYAAMRNEVQRRAQNREAKQRQRVRNQSADVSQGQPDVSNVSPAVAVALAGAVAVAKAGKTRARSRAHASVSLPDCLPEAFERFWAKYPLRKARKAACKAWDSLRPDDALLLEISAGLERYVREVQGRPRDKIAHAATWLNGERWADEPTPDIPLAQIVAQNAPDAARKALENDVARRQREAWRKKMEEERLEREREEAELASNGGES